jgi:hypothetical protein
LNIGPAGSMLSGGGAPCFNRYSFRLHWPCFGPRQYWEINPRQADSKESANFLKNPHLESNSQSAILVLLRESWFYTRLDESASKQAHNN